MHEQLAEVALILGRVLLGGVFVFGGIEHFLSLQHLAQMMSKRGVPLPMTVLVAGSIFQIVFGVALMVGVLVPWACLGLVVFTIAATIMFLNFWDMQGFERVAARNTAVVNVAVVGGLVVAAAQALG